MYFLYQLILLDEKKVVARKTLMLLLAFPTAFYFGSVYTESLFLLLVVSSFYALRRGFDKEAIVLAAFASATRIIGIFMLPALLYEKYLQLKQQGQEKKIIKYGPFIFSGTGLLLYMYYLGVTFSDPVYFLNAQPAFGAQRSTHELILLYQVIFRYFKMFVSVDISSLLYYTITQEFVISIVFAGLLVLAWFKGVRKSYLLFAAPAYLLPTLTGTFSSMPRYVLVLFPAFMVLAKIIPNRWFNLVLAIFALFLGINTLLFTRGYWIA